MPPPGSDTAALPQEICDLILDTLAWSKFDSKSTRLSDLKACSLVSKGWRMRAAVHLFKSITLPSPTFSQVEWVGREQKKLSSEEEAELMKQAATRLQEAVQPGGMLSSASSIVLHIQLVTLNVLSSIEFLDQALPLLQQIPFKPNQLRGITLDRVVLVPPFLSYLSALLLDNNDSVEQISFHELTLTTTGFVEGATSVDILITISNIFPPLPNLQHLYLKNMDVENLIESQNRDDEDLISNIPLHLPRPSPKTLTLDIDDELGAVILEEFLFNPERAFFDLASTRELNLTHYEYELSAHSRVLLGAEASLHRFSVRVCRKPKASRAHFYAPSRDDIRRDTEIIKHLPQQAPNLTHFTAFLELKYYRTEQFIHGLPELKTLRFLQVLDIQVDVDFDSFKSDSDRPILTKDADSKNWDSIKTKLMLLDDNLEILTFGTLSDSLTNIGVAIKVKGVSLETAKSFIDPCFPQMKLRSSPRFNLDYYKNDEILPMPSEYLHV